jgi:hypothetical protein
VQRWPRLNGEGDAMNDPSIAIDPRSGDAPPFAEPWQAHAFAMVVQLHAQAAGDADRGDTYYAHWLAALERIVASKGASSAGELSRYAAAWDHAADRTPHGQPIELRDDDFVR